MLVTTLKYLFAGRRKLFADLWIADKIDWEAYPVIHLDMNTLDYLSRPLEDELSTRTVAIAKEHQVSLSSTTAKGRFAELLQKLSTEARKCAGMVPHGAASRGSVETNQVHLASPLLVTFVLVLVLVLELRISDFE